MNYQEEKDYLNAIVLKYLSNYPNQCMTFRQSGIDNEGKPFNSNGPIIPLYYFGDIVDTELVSIFINECDEIQVEVYMNDWEDTDYSMFIEFSNDEMKLIMEKMHLIATDDDTYKYLGFFTKEVSEQILDKYLTVNKEDLLDAFMKYKDDVFKFKKAIGDAVYEIQDACCGVESFFFKDYLFTTDGEYINVYRLY